MDVPRTRSAAAGHLPALDGVRGLAILGVLIYHFSGPLARNFQNFPQKIVGAALSAGWVGVDLFFVLSGFLITRNLLCLSGTTSERLTFFWRNRALRIFPIYLFFLVVYALAVRVPPLSYWLYYCNWTQPYQPDEIISPLSHFWSLAVEEQFYLVWPVAALLLPKPNLRACSWAIVLIVPVLRTIAVAFDLSPNLIYRATLFRVDALVLGALVAQGVGWRAPLFIGAAATIPVVLFCRGFAWGHPLMQTVGYTAIAFCFAGVVGWAARTSAWPIRMYPLRMMGKYSYGAYILHWPLAVATWDSAAALKLGLGYSAILILAECLAVFTAAYVCYELVEKRFLQFRGEIIHPGPLVGRSSV